MWGTSSIHGHAWTSLIHGGPASQPTGPKGTTNNLVPDVTGLTRGPVFMSPRVRIEPNPQWGPLWIGLVPARPTDAQFYWDQGNMENGLTPQTLCHVPQAIPLGVLHECQVPRLPNLNCNEMIEVLTSPLSDFNVAAGQCLKMSSIKCIPINKSLKSRESQRRQISF